LIVYDITKKESFENVQNWLGDIRSYADEDVGLLLIGNKVDMVDQRQVQTEEGQEWATKLGMSFLETSAKSGQGVESAFVTLVEQLFEKK
jgi:small GTP-binding protein